VGNDGETLVADSSTSTGLRYTAGTVQGNPVLNSAMQIAQRGTSIALAANTRGYTLDRWDAITATSNACVISRQATGDTTNLPNIQYALRYQRNSGQTGTGAIYLANSFETINSIPYAGKTVTFSFYARKGANFSQASSALSAVVATGTGTDQAILGGYTGTAEPINLSVTLTTTWQRFTGTGTLSSSMNEMSIYFGYTPSGTAGAADYYEVTGVQIDVGSVALPFRTYAATIQGELAACQRYFYRSASNDFFFSGNVTSGSGYFSNVFNPVTMRVAPTISSLAVGSSASFNNATITTGGITVRTVAIGCTANATAAAGFFIGSFDASSEL
jgi:hypothetical protein